MKIEGVMTVQVTQIVEGSEEDLRTFLDRRDSVEAAAVKDFMREYNADNVTAHIQYFAHDGEVTE